MTLAPEKAENLHKFCTVTFFIRVLHPVTLTADAGPLTPIDYYDRPLFHDRIRDHAETQPFDNFQSNNLLLKITIRSCQQQTNGADCRIYVVTNVFQDFHSRGIL